MNQQSPGQPSFNHNQQPSSSSFCRHCGAALPPQGKFCRRCGQPVPAAAPTPIYPPAGYPQTQPTFAAAPRRHKHRFKAVALTLAGVLLVFVILGIIGALSDGGDSGQIDLGAPTELASLTLAAGGGQILVKDDESVLNGLTLKVPEDAYDQKQNWKISETPIKDHQFGELFNPATPLITLDNGHDFAAVPMTLTIPIKKSVDEFAMAFYYDRSTGELEGIPCLAQDEKSITIATAHFSDIVVSKVRQSMLEGRIQNDAAASDFMPGMSDFFAPNNGSIAEYDGHCTGQSLAEIHYYNSNNNDNYSGSTLRGEDSVDNGLLPATPGFWQDDNLAYRFSSLLQRDFVWGTSYTESFLNLPEDLVYYSFAYAMSLTHSPQIIVIYGKDSTGHRVGHTMVVYGVTPDGLAISDPNYPGDLDRKVAVTRNAGNASDLGLANYQSGINANQPGTSFDEFAYFGTYALFDFDKIDQLWQDVLAGKDVGAGIFPADLSFLVMTGRDDNQKAIYSPLKSGFTITRPQTEDINSDKPGRLFMTIPAADKDARYTFYMGTELLGTVDNLGLDIDKWVNFALGSGANDVGILYERLDKDGQYEYVNFYRYMVNFTDGAPTPSPTPTKAPTATTAAPSGTSNWQLTVTWTSECQHAGGIALMAHNLPFEQADHLNKPETWQATLAESVIPKPGAVTFTIPGYVNYTFTGTLSADRQTITGECTFTWTNGEHWIKGPFTMKRQS